MKIHPKVLKLLIWTERQIKGAANSNTFAILSWTHLKIKLAFPPLQIPRLYHRDFITTLFPISVCTTRCDWHDIGFFSNDMFCSWPIIILLLLGRASKYICHIQCLLPTLYFSSPLITRVTWVNYLKLNFINLQKML